MKRILVLFFTGVLVVTTNAQMTDSIFNLYTNSADNILSNDSKLVVGGYGEVHYNQPINKAFKRNGELDVHRIVMLFGYHLNEKTKFVTELEFEHVYEVGVE